MPPSQSKPCSLRHYDHKRAVNTPNSLEACAIEGVLPESLVRSRSPGEAPAPVASTGSAGATPRGPPTTAQQLQHQKNVMIFQHQEQERLKALALVKKRYTELIKEDTKNVVSESATNSPRKRGIGFIPGADFHKEINDAISADLSVAAYFYRQATSLEGRAAISKVLAENKAALEERIAAHAARKEKEAQLKAKRNEEHHQVVLRNQEKRDKEVAAHKAERLQHAEQRTAKVAENAEKIFQEKSKRRESKVDSKELELARTKKLQALEAKIAHHQELAKERFEQSAGDQELHALKVALKRQGFVDQKARLARACEFNKEHLQQQVDKEREAEEIELAQQELAAKKRSIIRQTLSTQRAEVDRYISEISATIGTTGSTELVDVRPPQWLAQRAERFIRARDAKQLKLSSAVKAPSGDASASGNDKSPRANVTIRGAKASDQGRGGSAGDRSDESARIPRPPKDNFTIATPRISERQSFPKWMFE